MIQDAPQLRREDVGGVCFWTDPDLRAAGVVVAFTERSGGVSDGPYGALNLADHVGDEEVAVNENRSRMLGALGLEATASRLVTAEQVHGTTIAVVDPEGAMGADAGRVGRVPIPATDALVTGLSRVPLLLCFADCVPVVLVAPGPVIAVVHAGWRGALARLPGLTATIVARQAGCDPAEIIAYVGPHIGACHYEVGEGILSQFVNTFDTVARAESGGLDLGATVAMSLRSAGVDPCHIASLGVCTAETTDRFFSYRAEAGLTGRHGALACIL